jgi:hypothetical protein
MGYEDRARSVYHRQERVCQPISPYWYDHEGRCFRCKALRRTWCIVSHVEEMRRVGGQLLDMDREHRHALLVEMPAIPTRPMPRMLVSNGERGIFLEIEESRIAHATDVSPGIFALVVSRARLVVIGSVMPIAGPLDMVLGSTVGARHTALPRDSTQ